MTPSFSEDPKDEPIEFDPREHEEEEREINPERADEVELRLAFREAITLQDVADEHHDKDGEVKGYKLSTTKAAYSLANKMRIAMEDKSEFIYWFNGEIYKPDGMRLADMKLCKLVGDEETVVKMREVERRMKNVLRSDLITFEPNPYLLAVRNGVIDLRTGNFREFRQEDYLLEKLDVIYDPKAKCPVFCGFMETVTNQVVDRLTLIDWLASHAIKIPLPYVVFLLGLGRNGKGLYEKLLKAFYGDQAFRDFAIDAPAKNQFAASKLFRKRGWIAAESNTTDKETVIGTELFKLISGDGSIDGDVKYSIDGAHFVPYTRITIDTNGMPRCKDKSIGWRERIVKINLPYLFLAMLKEGDPQVKLRDQDLFEKLSTTSEMSGILNLIIDRTKLICKTKMITKRPGEEMLKEYGDQSNSVTTFLNLFCEYDNTMSGLLTEFAPIYEAFEEWCQLTVSEKVDAGYFGKLLKKLCGGIEPKISKVKSGDKRVQVKLYRGLTFDVDECQKLLTTLRAGFKEENVYGVHTESTVKSTDEHDPLIALSIVSIDKQWKDILEKYSDISLYRDVYPEKAVDTMPTMDTPSSSPDNGGAANLHLCPKPALPMDIPTEFSACRVEGTTSLLPDPKHDNFMAGFKKHTQKQRRTCHICGEVSDHELTQDQSTGEMGCYICATCHISHRTRGKPAPVETFIQTSLAY
jgi:P4 family phage/plasmid primase-like protien